jgi:hypothetical protein
VQQATILRRALLFEQNGYFDIFYFFCAGIGSGIVALAWQRTDITILLFALPVLLYLLPRRAPPIAGPSCRRLISF